MSLAFEIRLVILGVTSPTQQLQIAGVVTPTLAHRVTMMHVQSPTLATAALAAMAGPGEYLADGGVWNGGSLG